MSTKHYLLKRIFNQNVIWFPWNFWPKQQQKKKENYREILDIQITSKNAIFKCLLKIAKKKTNKFANTAPQIH